MFLLDFPSQTQSKQEMILWYAEVKTFTNEKTGAMRAAI